VPRPPGGAALIDRDPQNLPVPLGGMTPGRRTLSVPAPLRLWRRRRSEVLAGIGLLLAVAAALVTVTRPDLAVYLDNDAVHVGALTLSPAAGNGGVIDGRLYRGPATLLLIARSDGTVVATAVTVLGGRRATGVCHFGPPTANEIAERCVLDIGGVSVTCEDSLRFDVPGVWQRRCSDGQELTVLVPAGAGVVPMPFPLGR